MRLTFFGGAGGVTGSKHLLEIGRELRVLLDCGFFQGLPDVRERNRSLPFPPESIDHVILSHAHLDHIGMLTLLVKRGFTGVIWATPATRDMVELMLLDAADIEVHDAAFRHKHHLGSPDERLPLFTPEDVPAVLERIQTIPYINHSNSWHVLDEGLALKFYDAGHILGSAVTVLQIKKDGLMQHLAYTGDLGQPNLPILRDPQVPTEEVETLLLESTYGARKHMGIDQAIDELAQYINKVCERGGKMIVPAFALGRIQGLVYVLHDLVDTGRIPRFPIYVDSPLATRITDVFRKYPEDYDQAAAEFLAKGDTPLAFSNLTYTQTVEESKALNDLSGPCMIISSSGMMTAGRVVHHLRNSISDSRNAILITGFQAHGTLGRRLLEGENRVEILGDRLTVRAEIAVFNEFSAHADASQLIEYAKGIQGLKRIFLVHGEPQQANVLAQRLVGELPQVGVYQPSEGQAVWW